ncbi:MAG: surface lipoprotein assembly modifier [Pseudomonadota bacterium]
MTDCARRRSVRRLVGAFAVISLLCLPTARSATAQQAGQRSDAELVELIAAGQIDEARALFATTAPDEADWLFFDGRLAKAEGHLDDAIKLFREVLRLNPEHLSARRELGHTLLQVADYWASAYHFRDLLRRDPMPHYRQGYVHFLNEIDRLRPFVLRGRLAIVSSSNVNRGSSESVFNPGVPDVPSFNITSRAEAGYGLELGISGQNRWTSDGRRRITFDWGLLGHKYVKPTYDRATLTARLQVGTLSEKTQWSMGPFVRASWAADGRNNSAIGLAASFDRRVTKQTIMFISAAAEYRYFPNSTAHDGPLFSLQTGLAHLVAKGDLSVGTRLTFNRPEREHQQYDGRALFARFSRSWSGGFQGGLGVEIGQREYGATFPLLDDARADEFFQVSFSAQHHNFRFGQYSPVLSCIFGTTQSNAAFFDHDVTECTVGVTTRF